MMRIGEIVVLDEGYYSYSNSARPYDNVGKEWRHPDFQEG